MTATPRVDAVVNVERFYADDSLIGLARQLERELAAAIGWGRILVDQAHAHFERARAAEEAATEGRKLLSEWLGTELDFDDDEYGPWMQDFICRVHAHLGTEVLASNPNPTGTGVSMTPEERWAGMLRLADEMGISGRIDSGAATPTATGKDASASSRLVARLREGFPVGLCTEAALEIERLERESAEAVSCLREFHAMVWGECPSLLNEDSGGCGRLDVAIREVIERHDVTNNLRALSK